ncbi:hypothetical protein L6R29_16755 [Myxococcota bacterium]|nr:hypothetical protein [Myxococcota bacterium]
MRPIPRLQEALSPSSRPVRRLDLVACSGLSETALRSSFSEIEALYRSVDGVLSAVSNGLDLPCHRGCSACCRQSVFLTPIEFLYGWHWAQTHLEEETLEEIVGRGIALYHEHKALIGSLEEASHQKRDAFEIARGLRFDCPYLGGDGACRIYPARELLGRLFGCSFLSEGALYACSLVEAHLQGRSLPFPRAPQMAQMLRTLPLSSRRQVYPYYLFHLHRESASLDALPWLVEETVEG